MKTKTLFLLLTGLLVFPAMLCAQVTLTVNKTITKDSTFYPFATQPLIYSMRINGTANLNSDTSLIRVILNNNLGEPYLVFETYSLLTDTFNLVLTDTADETKYLKKIIPASVSVQVVDGSAYIGTITYDTVAAGDVDLLMVQQKSYMDSCKIVIMNERIIEEHMYWRAGATNQISKFYRERWQNAASVLPYDGNDYYKGGIFEIIGRRNYTFASANMVSSFDWRKRHGANQPGSPYYDGDANGTGWFTPAKNQEPCSLCYVFAPVGAVEARLNLYYNKHGNNSHPDISISEMDVWSCPFKLNGSCDTFGYQNQSYTRLKDDYRVDCTCLPYIPANNCSNKCTNANEHEQVKIESEWHVPLNVTPTEDDLKTYLITKGPYSVRLPSFFGEPHYVVLSGFDVLVANKIVYENPLNKFDFIMLPEDSPLVGVTTWCFKNSWGSDWGNNGFCSTPMVFSQIDLAQIQGPAGKVLWKKHETEQAVCSDEDRDGYYWWGIGERPTSCGNCDALPDCDDNNPMVGPYDETFACKPLCQALGSTTNLPAGTLTQDIHFFNNLVVNTGTVIVQNCTVWMVPGTTITVKSGATLILDGGTITTGCGSLWQGIIVEGSTATLPAGKVILTGSNPSFRPTISKAVCAISLLNNAIVKATNANFFENKTSIALSNFINNTESFFTNCSFKLSGFLLEYVPFDCFVNLTNYGPITFSGCYFGMTDNLMCYGIGIKSNNATFKCLEYSGAGSQATPCRFENLKRGIQSISTNGSLAFPEVRKCQFLNNARGMYLSGVTGAIVKDNTFTVPLVAIEPDPNLPPGRDGMPYDGIGLYVNTCPFFTIENNHFTKAYSSSGFIGMYIKSTGGLNNLVYNNNFNTFHYGIIAEGNNRDINGNYGLVFKCNDFTACGYDISVTKSSPTATNQGVCKSQGTNGTQTTDPAGNTFSYVWAYPESDYYNEGEILQYWYHAISNGYNIKPEYYTSQKIIPKTNSLFPLSYNKLQSCLLHLDNKTLMELNSDVTNSLKVGDSLTAMLSLLTDGGNTPQLVNEIQASTPNEEETLKTSLLEKSPYLSDSSLIHSVLKEDVLSASSITSILSENPQAAKADTLQTLLDNRLDLLTAEQRAEIDLGLTLVSPKEALESKVTGAAQAYTCAFFGKINHFLKDSTPLANDSITNLLSNEPNLWAKYLMVGFNLSQNHIEGAMDILASIPTVFTLSEQEAQEYNSFAAYCELYAAIISDSLNTTPFDSTRIAQLTELNTSSRGMAAALSHNFLVAAGLQQVYEPIVLPVSGLKMQRVHKVKQAVFGAESGWSVLPNPASDYLLVTQPVNPQSTLAEYELVDQAGRLVQAGVLPAKASCRLQIGTLQAGYYVARFSRSGQVVYQVKLFIQQ